MEDFLTRLAARSQGWATVVRPLALPWANPTPIDLLGSAVESDLSASTASEETGSSSRASRPAGSAPDDDLPEMRRSQRADTNGEALSEHPFGSAFSPARGEREATVPLRSRTLDFQRDSKKELPQANEARVVDGAAPTRERSAGATHAVESRERMRDRSTATQDAPSSGPQDPTQGSAQTPTRTFPSESAKIAIQPPLVVNPSRNDASVARRPNPNSTRTPSVSSRTDASANRSETPPRQELVNLVGAEPRRPALSEAIVPDWSRSHASEKMAAVDNAKQPTPVPFATGSGKGALGLERNHSSPTVTTTEAPVETPAASPVPLMAPRQTPRPRQPALSLTDYLKRRNGVSHE